MSKKPDNKPNAAIDNSTPVPGEQSKSSAVEGELSEHELSKVSAGLVAVKTVSWPSDDVGPKETATFEYGGLKP